MGPLQDYSYLLSTKLVIIVDNQIVFAGLFQGNRKESRKKSKFVFWY